MVDGVDVVPEVHAVLDRMAAFARQVRRGEWRGFTGKPIRNIINIGIGGSDLGIVMARDALTHYRNPAIRLHCVSNVDGTQLADVLRQVVAGGGRVLVYDPRPVELPCAAGRLTCTASCLPDILRAIGENDASALKEPERQKIAPLMFMFPSTSSLRLGSVVPIPTLPITVL